MANKQIQDFDLKATVDGTEDVLIQDNGTTKRVKASVLINVNNNNNDVDLSNYYTKSEVYNKSQVDNLIDGVESNGANLSNYYTKSETYNKSEVNNLIDDVNAGDVDLTNYYTKSQVDDLIDNVDVGDVDLTNYYTKSEVDNIVDNVETDVDLSNYYNKSEVNNLIDNIDTTVDLSNYYRKSETYSRTEAYSKAEVNALVANNSGGGSSSGSGVTSASLGIVNVKDYGAKGDGTTDDTQAIKNAIVYMCSQAERISTESGWKSLMPTLYFPNGRYIISQKGALNCVGGALQGYNIKGAGYLNTEILYTYNSANDLDGGYLLVNGDENWFGFSYIEDLTIRGNGNNNFWQIKSRDGSPQANRFSRVAFFDLKNCVTVNFGTYNYNADLFRFESCKASAISGWIFGVEGTQNSQSVVHTFRDCDFENITGYGIYMQSGGTIEIRGGSWIAKQNGRLLHFDDISGAGIGTSNRNVNIYGTKFEYQYYSTTDSNLDYYPLFYNNSRMIIHFYGCNFSQFSYKGNSTKANYGYIGIMGSVYFNGCQIPEVFGIKTNPQLGVAMGNMGQKQVIKFKDCLMNSTLDKIVSQVNVNTYQGGNYSDVIAEDCFTSKSTGNFHIDTQLNQFYGNRLMTSKKKMAILTRSVNPTTSLPANGQEMTYDIPMGAIITDIIIYFKTTSNSPTHTISVYNSEGALLLEGNNTGNTQPTSIRSENVFEVVDSSDYYIRVTCSGGTSNIGGFVAIEYY